MSLSFFPKTVKFYDLFKEQNRKLAKAAGILDLIFSEFDEVEEKCKQINIIEYEGNRISRTIALELSQTFITPIDREDIHEINVRQESTLNIIKAISNRVGVYDFTELKYPAKKVVSNLKAMAEEIGTVLDCLHKRCAADSSIEKIKSLKYECEMLLLVGIGEIFDSHGLNLMGTLEILKWTHIYDRIEQAVEGVEVLCETLEGILLKYA